MNSKKLIAKEFSTDITIQEVIDTLKSELKENEQQHGAIKITFKKDKKTAVGVIRIRERGV